MRKTARCAEVSNALHSRYGLGALHCEDWGELMLFGGIGMDASTFNALADAARALGDIRATVYELETVDTQFAPVSISLDFPSFNDLKRDAISHFELAVVPPSEAWAALLTDELETLVYGPPNLLSNIARNLSQVE